MNTNTCPICGADHTQGGQLDVGRDHAIQECTCSQCEAEWTLVFKLVDKEITYDPKNDNHFSPDVNGDHLDQDYDGPDQSDREPSHGPDYWRNEAGEPRLG